MTGSASPVTGPDAGATSPDGQPARRVGQETRGGQPEPLTIPVQPRSLVVLAGLPGAGKSTLLARLHVAGAPATVLDSDQVRTVLRAALPAWVPYRWYRPLVHLAHRARILGHALTAPGLLVVHEPSTRSTTRGALVAVGLLTGRSRHLLWLHASPAEALAGQRDRGRLIRPGAFLRHVRRARAVRERCLAGRPPRGWTGFRLLDRAATAAGVRLSVTFR